MLRRTQRRRVRTVIGLDVRNGGVDAHCLDIFFGGFGGNLDGRQHGFLGPVGAKEVFPETPLLDDVHEHGVRDHQRNAHIAQVDALEESSEVAV